MFLAPILLLAALIATPAQDKKDGQAPFDVKRIDAAVAELDAAFKDGKTADERVAAIKKNAEVLDARVVSGIEKGLKDKDKAVQTAAVEALGRMKHPSALESLHKLYKSEHKRLKDDEALLPLVFKSIGRHGSESSVEILSDDLFLQRTFPAIQARVMSLGNIRSKKSLAALIEMMNKAGPRQVNDYMNLFRQSLMRLSGVDQGPDSQLWTKWWQDNKDKFEVPKETPKLPEIAEKAWNEYWELAPKKETPGEGGGEKKG